MNKDRAYFARRAAEESAAAVKATHPKVRAAHLEMAKLYEQRLSELADHAGPSGVRLVGAA